MAIVSSFVILILAIIWVAIVSNFVILILVII